MIPEILLIIGHLSKLGYKSITKRIIVLKNTMSPTGLKITLRTRQNKKIGNAPENEVNNWTPNAGNQEIIDKTGFSIRFQYNNLLTT